MPRYVLLARLVVAALFTAVPAAHAAGPALRVEGNRLVGASGTAVRIAGVNRAGSEYACAQGWGIFDGPTDDQSIDAIAGWGVNAVRVPLNESCWLAINRAPAAYSGAAYRNAIRGYVDRLRAKGLAVILDLHWAAPGSKLALGQTIAPDADHAPAFWRSVAAQYKDVPGIAYDLFNEPRDISWSCWRDGCTTSEGWQAAGMQQLVDAVRSTGATQPVIAMGLNWGGDLSGWPANRPTDPAGQLAAGWHVYNFSGCNTTDCWDRTVAPVAAQVPVVASEIGENDCAGGFLDTLLPWADAHGIGYVAWAWNTADCRNGPSLISAYDGTPTGYGAAYKRHLAPAAVDAAARFDFEDATTQGWAVRWGNTVAATPASGTAWSGSRGLALDVSGTGYPAVGADRGLGGVGAGTVVTYRVWAPQGIGASVSPMVLDGRWNALVLGARSLSPGWNTITFSVPASVADGVRVLGLQVNDGSGWRGRLVLDDVTWQPVRFDFEDGTAAGWSVRWGNTVSPAGTTTTAFTGTHGLALDVTGTGWPGIGTDRAVSALAAGSTVTYRIWAPQGVAAGIAPMLFDTAWKTTVLADRPLAPGWNTITFTIPAGTAGVRVIGLQVDDAGGWRGRLVLDAVAF